MNSSLPFCVRIACAAIVIGLIGTTATAADWKPEKPIEVITGVAPGGALDLMARAMQKIWQDNHMLEATVVNKVGGGGALLGEARLQ